MIGILLTDCPFEQDIRELTMAFYPGETFVHEEQEDVAFYVKVTGTEKCYHLEIIDTEIVDEKLTNREYSDTEVTDVKVSDTKAADSKIPDRKLPDTRLSNIEAESNRCSGDGQHLESYSDKIADDRFETKNLIKQELYHLLQKKTGKTLPWGTLTGIRPTKIAMAKLEEGWSEKQTSEYLKETYLASDDKIELCVKTAETEKNLLKNIDYKWGYSLYVGIPFCPTTCLYCSFTSYPIGRWVGKTKLYLDALFKELEYTAERMKDRPLDTIYFGGGTPTSLPAEDIDAILCKIESLFDLSQIQEFTVEAGRPDSITREKLQVLRSHNITRISINPQTMKQATLDLIGRHHTVDMVKDCFRMAREMGFDNINMDLIIGLPEETMEDVERTMEEIKALAPDSITVHSLAIKRAARLNMFKDKYENLTITNTQEMIDLTARYAKDMGLEPYYLYRQKNMAGNFENVGYATPGKACIYNILIMEEKQTIVACGAGTTTKVVFPAENRLERVENVKDVEIYIARIDEMIERKEKMLANL